MADKKKQHYVPKFYMKNFADSKKNVSVYNLKSKKVIADVPYNSQCYKDYFYGKDHVLEDEFAKKETLWNVPYFPK